MSRRAAPWLGVAVALLARSAAAQESPVALDAPPEDPLGRRVSEELNALGHPVIPARAGGSSAVLVTVAREGARARAVVRVAGAAPIALELSVTDDESLAIAALRVVEAVRAGLLPRTVASPAVPPRASPMPRVSPWASLHGALGIGLCASPGSVDVTSALYARIAWEGRPWVELVGHVALDAASVQGGTLRVSTVTAGVGAALAQGPRGALGVTLRAGIVHAETRGESGSSGVVGVAAGALLGRLRVYRRLGLIGEIAVGTALAPVRIRAGTDVVAEWGRPFLHASIGVSF